MGLSSWSKTGWYHSWNAETAGPVTSYGHRVGYTYVPQDYTGWYIKYRYITRITATTDAYGATKLTVTIPKGALIGGGSYRCRAIVNQDAEAYKTSQLNSGYKEIPQPSKTDAVLEFAQNYSPNTTYYVWLVANGEGYDFINLENMTVAASGSYGTAGVPSASNGSFGKAIPITISGHSAGATFVVKASCAGNTETLLNNSASTSLTWTPAVATYAPLITSASSASASITVETYYGGTKFYTQTKSITLSWAAGTIPPKLSSGWCAAAPLNEGAASGFTVWIQKYSKARVTFTPGKVTTQYGASISSFKVKLDSVTTAASNNTATTAVITATSAKLLCTVTDSRGQTASQTLTVTLNAYSNPVLSGIDMFRSDASGKADADSTYVSAKATATISSLGGQNSFTMTVQSRPVSGSWSAASAMSSGVVKLLSGINPDTTYEIKITLTDALGNTASFTQKLPTRQWAMKFRPDGNGVAFGKAAENDKALEIPEDWTIRFGNTLSLDSGLGSIANGNNSVNYSITSGKLLEINSVTLTHGTWLITAFADYAANSTGTRCLLLTTGETPLLDPGRENMVKTLAVNAGDTYMELVRVVMPWDTTTYHFYGYQNSGSTLKVYPYVRAIRLF